MQATALIIFSLTLIGAAVASPVLAKVNADIRVLNMLAESNALGNSASPDVTSECFKYYLPILNIISTNFSYAYQKCITTANTATNSLNQAATFNQTTFSKDAAVICHAFSACDNDNDTLSFFDCYASSASNDVADVYSLSANALTAAITLKTGLQEIKSAEDLCSNNAQSNYVMKTADVYDQLNSCFINGLPDTSTAAPRTSTAPGTSAAPETSAEPKTSAEPNTSAAPESTAARSSPVQASSAAPESTAAPVDTTLSENTLPASHLTSATSAASSI